MLETYGFLTTEIKVVQIITIHMIWIAYQMILLDSWMKRKLLWQQLEAMDLVQKLQLQQQSII